MLGAVWWWLNVKISYPQMDVSSWPRIELQKWDMKTAKSNWNISNFYDVFVEMAETN